MISLLHVKTFSLTIYYKGKSAIKQIKKHSANEEDKEFEPQYPAQLYTARPNPTALLSPLYDSTFKGIFTQETEDSKLALQSFVSAVVERNVKNVILKPNEPAKDGPNQKGMIYDISVEFDNGELSDIEMQAWKEDYDYGIRAEIQAARLLNNNAKKSDDWDSPKVYQISILNFHYRKDDNKILSWYTMKNESAESLADRQNIIAAIQIIFLFFFQFFFEIFCQDTIREALMLIVCSLGKSIRS